MFELPMDYQEWIARERKIRIKLLMTSPAIRETGLFPVCLDCREVCLCHEIKCPNCGGQRIGSQAMEDVDAEVCSGNRIRCRDRFEHLA